MENIKVPTRDEIIVRQSQMERAIEIFQLTGKKPSVRQICKLSKLLTEFIFTWDEDAEGLKKFDKFITNEFKEELVNKLTK